MGRWRGGVQVAAGRRVLWARGERAGQAAAWAARSWAEPEAVGRVRKGNRGTGLGPREEERGWRAGPAGFEFWAGSGFLSLSISFPF